MKTYCISDIHAHYDVFERFLETLEDDDKVYVLGDAIDKGKEPIKVLKTIMNDKRFTMLMGNHEYMMFQFLAAERGSVEQKENYEAWVKWNHGLTTLDQYLELPPEEQVQIFIYIMDLPLNIPEVVVGDKKYYLVHSCPGSEEMQTVKKLNFDDDAIAAYVWDRVEFTEEFKEYDKIVVAGHAIVQEVLGFGVEEARPVFDQNADITPENTDVSACRYIDIDGGLEGDIPSSRLIALCLDDLTYRTFQ